MKYVITIGREYGSGGRFIAKLLAERLGINYYDDELFSKTVQREKNGSYTRSIKLLFWAILHKKYYLCYFLIFASKFMVK